LASHEFDIAILLQNFRHYMPPACVDLGIKMTEIWLDYAYNLGWPSDADKKTILKIGQNKITLVAETEYDRVFHRGRGQLMQDIGWKRCFRMGEMLQGCYPDD
jgi:hypothetical protein